MKSAISSCLLMVTAAFAANCWTTDADAHGRVFVGGGVIIGQPYYAYPPYYGYPYYAYPPTGAPYPYPYPQPAYPQPAYAEPYQLPPPLPTDHYYQTTAGEYCREYTHTVIIDRERQRLVGHACRQPDGSWHIID